MATTHAIASQNSHATAGHKDAIAWLRNRRTLGQGQENIHLIIGDFRLEMCCLGTIHGYEQIWPFLEDGRSPPASSLETTGLPPALLLAELEQVFPSGVLQYGSQGQVAMGASSGKSLWETLPW